MAPARDHMMTDLQRYPLNPRYGQGLFRRRIVRSAAGRRASATLLDDFHEMEVALTVENGVIVGADGTMARYPKTTCPGACAALGALRGLGAEELRASVDRGGQCTHLFDLATLVLPWFLSLDAGKAGLGERRQVIEIAVTDRDTDQRQRLELTVDGTTTLVWELCDEAIVEPVEHAGRELFKSYGRWVYQTFAPQDADLWRMAQMAVFVARGRQHVLDGPELHQLTQETIRRGACFSYSGAAFDLARDSIGYIRDLTNGLPPLTWPDSPVVREARP